MPGQDPAPASVDLYWLPLGAGGRAGVVRASGRAYEAVSAHRHHRPAAPLVHSALEVDVDTTRYVLEMTPVWALPDGDRGVVGEGAVGSRLLGRWRLFRYEVHCWPGGSIPDVASALGGALRLSSDAHRARAVVELVHRFPTRTWGRDEQRAGDMWNSNSLTSWLLSRSGHDVTDLRPPHGGRAPGWEAGRVVAARPIGPGVP